MLRERALKIVLALVGLFFSAAIYPVIGGLLDPAHSDTGDTMMMGLYFALSIFLLIAVRNPSAHRSLIAFAAWSSFAHAVVMSVLGFEIASERVGFLVGSAVLVVIGAALSCWLRENNQGGGQPQPRRNCCKNPHSTHQPRVKSVFPALTCEIA